MNVVRGRAAIEVCLVPPIWTIFPFVVCASSCCLHVFRITGIGVYASPELVAVGLCFGGSDAREAESCALHEHYYGRAVSRRQCLFKAPKALGRTGDVNTHLLPQLRVLPASPRD